MSLNIASSMRKHNFAVLDGLRGVAAIVVVVAHLSSMMIGHALFERKYMAVQFFFMLSGFVVMCAYEQPLRTNMSFFQFCLRRAIRLYPLIWVGTLLGWLYYGTLSKDFAVDPDGLRYVWLSALGLPTLKENFNLSKFPINPPEWSLFFEFGAYIAFGMLVRFASTKAIAVLATVGLLFYSNTTLSYTNHDMPFRYNVFGIWASFMIGMLLWRAYQAKLFSSLSVSFPVLAVIIVVSCAIPEQFPAALNIALIALIFPAIMLFGANCIAPKLQRTLAFLGELSYPLYILHWPIAIFTKHALFDALGPTVTTLASCLFSIMASWVIYVALDKPMRAWLTLKLCAPATSNNFDGAQPS